MHVDSSEPIHAVFTYHLHSLLKYFDTITVAMNNSFSLMQYLYITAAPAEVGSLLAIFDLLITMS